MPGIVLVGEFSERFSHVEEPYLVVGVGDLLRQPHAFRGISTVIDSGKKGKGSPPLTNLYPAPPSAAAGLPSHWALISMRVREV